MFVPHRGPSEKGVRVWLNACELQAKALRIMGAILGIHGMPTTPVTIASSRHPRHICPHVTLTLSAAYLPVILSPHLPTRSHCWPDVASLAGVGKRMPIFPVVATRRKRRGQCAVPLQKTGKWDLNFTAVWGLEGFWTILGHFTSIQLTQILWMADLASNGPALKHARQYRNPWVSRSLGHKTVGFGPCDNGRDGLGVWDFCCW